MDVSEEDSQNNNAVAIPADNKTRCVGSPINNVAMAVNLPASSNESTSSQSSSRKRIYTVTSSSSEDSDDDVIFIREVKPKKQHFEMVYSDSLHSDNQKHATDLNETIVCNGDEVVTREHRPLAASRDLVTGKETVTCECCYDDEVTLDNIVKCSKLLHNFCKPCVVKCCEVNLGKAETIVKCMTECDGVIAETQLQLALPAQLFQKWQTQKQRAEIEKANIEGLKYCPFCEFACIVPPGTIVFLCLNESCKKKSCLNCRKLSHLPEPCHESNSDVVMRQKVEEAMTEALVRKCYRCAKQFVKSDGCNKIVCTCGAASCYVCRQPVSKEGYSHFHHHTRREGSCPLWVDEGKLHVDQVYEAGRKVRDDALTQNPDVHLIYDPTNDEAQTRNQTTSRRKRRVRDIAEDFHYLYNMMMRAHPQERGAIREANLINRVLTVPIPPRRAGEIQQAHVPALNILQELKPYSPPPIRPERSYEMIRQPVGDIPQAHQPARGLPEPHQPAGDIPKAHQPAGNFPQAQRQIPEDYLPVRNIPLVHRRIPLADPRQRDDNIIQQQAAITEGPNYYRPRPIKRSPQADQPIPSTSKELSPSPKANSTSLPEKGNNTQDVVIREEP